MSLEFHINRLLVSVLYLVAIRENILCIISSALLVVVVVVVVVGVMVGWWPQHP